MNLEKSVDYVMGEQMFKEYTLNRFVGQSEFGRVCLVENSVGLPFVLKVFHKDVEMEQRSIAAVMRIRSNRLVSILDYGETVEGEACVLMGYVKDNLEDVVDWGEMGEQQSVKYFKEILKGLKVLEKNGIIHRDLKPENLFVLDDIVMIGGLGTARYMSKGSATMSNEVMIRHYTAPECLKKEYGFSVDRWAACVMFYRMLTGEFPFDGDDNMEISGSIMQSEPDLAKVPAAYRDFLRRAFAKSTDKRHESAVEMMVALEEVSMDGLSKTYVGSAPRTVSRAVGRLPARSLEPVSPITNNIGMMFVWIRPGSFMIGSPEDEKEREIDETLHRVSLTKGFYLQTTPVTQGQWKKVMGNNPSYFKNCGDECPVEQVSWDDCQEFIKSLNGMGKNDVYRLPTEAEWEYACRAGTTTPFSFGDSLSTDEANYDGSHSHKGYPKGKWRKKPTPVGDFPSNSWGLYDMHGNVWEWCQDWYGDYSTGPVTNPAGLSDGTRRVLRGGSWNYYAWNCRSAYRGSILPGYRYGGLGFRLLKS